MKSPRTSAASLASTQANGLGSAGDGVTLFRQTPQELTLEERNAGLYADGKPSTRAADVSATTPLQDISLNWTEKQLPERERTKHVHRLHPYLGKYVPQLAEVFLRKFLVVGQTVLDPFCGSGTTLVQANELGMNSVGCDISAFNILLCKVKTDKYHLPTLEREAADVLRELAKLTNQHEAPNQGTMFEGNDTPPTADMDASDYLKTWFAPQALAELITFRSLIEDCRYRDFFRVVLSRSARSARLTTHFDLDFPKAPTTQPYQCYKHGRVCAPTETAFKFIARYCADGVRRVERFAAVRSDAKVQCVHGDSRLVNLPPVDAIVTSPPYVGLIDYHEQHRYAYELLGLADNHESEIGAAANGQSAAARDAYCRDMTSVFRNVVSNLRPGGALVVVAADRHALYPRILGDLGLVERHVMERHVNRRTGRRGSRFYESIFIYTKR